MTGLRSLAVEEVETCTCWNLVSCLYTIQVIILMLIGYVLQYMACFRRDRGFCYTILSNDPSTALLRELDSESLQADVEKHEQICHGSAVFSYIIPCFLHLCAYLYGIYIFRSSENDQLPSLMERVSNLVYWKLMSSSLYRSSISV